MRSTRRWTWHLEIHSGLLCASRDMIWIHIMYTYHKRIGFASCKDDNKDKKLNLTGSLFETYLKSHITLNSFYWYLWHEKHMVYQNLFKDYVACQRPLKCFKTMFLSYYWKLCQTCMETKEENPKPHLLMSEKTFEEAKNPQIMSAEIPCPGDGEQTRGEMKYPKHLFCQLEIALKIDLFFS